MIKILLVDDLKDNLLALEWLLKRDDLEIFKARCGTDALEFISRHEFALALIDVQMPGMSGFELAELIRGTNKTKSVPIIFVSATAKSESFSFRGYESGAVDFLLKPLDTHALKNKVNIFIELFRQRQELELTLTKLRNTEIELEQAVQIRDEFMSIASHELKTPLTVLKLQSQLRKRRIAKGDSKSFTAEAMTRMFVADEKQLDRITHLIDDMLDISRINSGKLSIRVEQFDLCELVRDLLERNKELFSAAACSVSSEFCGGVRGNWDRFRIEQVVTNLLTNAMRYGAGKPIFVQVESSRGMARIVVQDHGQGIAPENHERIFQRFERAAGKEVNGLGLGLYIVKEILTAHGGSIRLESEVGVGSSFYVELPPVESPALNAAS
ncbi:MAG: hybrid sensor histidine kinase/response regulator [Methylotenera sp.]|nr:hybrid sensor histidine kinase/response regulator [Oligoflexia bacterium]